MESFLTSLLIVLLLFFACLLFAVAIRGIATKTEKIKTPPKESGDAKIYYITNYREKPKPKPKPRVKKSPNIALKGTIIRPDQFQKIMVDEENNFTRRR